jgi:hypothetical protein
MGRIMGHGTWNLLERMQPALWNRVAQEYLNGSLKRLDNRKYPRGERFKSFRSVASGHVNRSLLDDAVVRAHGRGSHACAVTASSQVWNTT